MTDRSRGRRGALRIYLGSAPGVGKTYAMLSEGRRRAERGADVVVGLVETHGRERTAELLTGLEVLPRGAHRDELDVAAVLARRPALVLVDEPAHRNPPGARNATRRQDIDELLAAGIDVLSGVNVADLASLGDVVEKITGVRQCETVPDEWVRGAEQIELVDITPEALRRRMAHGNIYPPEKIDAALSHYFRPVNLVALRELALLWLADEVDTALRRHRAEQEITEVWEARERVVVAVTGGTESETVLRRAARIASRAGRSAGGADLLCVHVLRTAGSAGPPPSALAGLRRLAEDVGASFHTVVGDDVPAALLDFATGANATQLVLGSSSRSRPARLFSPGVAAAVIARSGPIDVHMVTHDRTGTGPSVHAPPRRGALPLGRRMLGWVLALVVPVAVTTLGVLANPVIGLSTDVVLFFLASVLVALVGGLGPAVSAALACGLLLNYFLTPPVHTFTIAERGNVITLCAMVVVAVTVALVVNRAARRAEQAAAARAEAALLASFARTVLTAGTDPLPRLLERVVEAFGLTSVAVLEREPPDGWRQVAVAGAGDCRSPEGAEVNVAMDHRVHLVARGRPLAASDRRVLETVGGQALLALRSQRMAAEAAKARAGAERAELQSALLGAVGHDLRTPLTSIKAAAGSLRDPELMLDDADRAELLATVEESADRLTGLVGNLLDSSRLAAGAVVPRTEAVGYDEVVALALAAVDGSGRVGVHIDESLPAVLADAGLLERVVANVVDNALRHGRGAPVAVRASVLGERVELWVADSGPGVAPDAAAGLFAPFQRLGDRDATSGIGLGLSVARGFTQAMGGTLTAEDTPGGGLTVVVSLPAAAR